VEIYDSLWSNLIGMPAKEALTSICLLHLRYRHLSRAAGDMQLEANFHKKSAAEYKN